MAALRRITSRCAAPGRCAALPALLAQPAPRPALLPTPAAGGRGCRLSASAGVAETRPPLAVRAGLVSASTALATPLFPIIGFNHLVFRFVPPEQRMAIHGGTSMAYLSAMVLLPNAFYYAPVLLPFAISNGVTAGGLYIVAEKASETSDDCHF